MSDDLHAGAMDHAAWAPPGSAEPSSRSALTLSPAAPAADPEEARLIASALAGDRAALESVWRRYRRWVAAIALASMPRGADLDDLLQDIAAIVVAKIRDVRDPGSLKPWLRSVAISVARTAGRRKAVRDRARSEIEDAARRQTHAVAPNPADEEARRLMDLAMKLPDGYREPLLLKCVRGLSYQQIAALLALPETTIETRIARARRMLRELAHEPESPGAARAPQPALASTASVRN